MVRADIIAGLEAMERGVGPGKRTPTQPPVFCFCKAELFSSITVAGGADLGDLTLVNPDAQTAVLEAVPDREISVFDNLTPDGSLVPEKSCGSHSLDRACRTRSATSSPFS